METKLTQPAFDVSMIWPGAFKKGERVSTAGNRLEEYFKCNGERYAMDFQECHMRGDWYQFDTDQDASYYGHWCNPVLGLVLSYIEGDIYLIHCKTNAAYRAELDAMESWNAQRMEMTVMDPRIKRLAELIQTQTLDRLNKQYPDSARDYLDWCSRYGIDDHDGKHDQKLAMRKDL